MILKYPRSVPVYNPARQSWNPRDTCYCGISSKRMSHSVTCTKRQLMTSSGKSGISVSNRPIQAKSVASVTNGGLGLETAMAPTVNKGWQLFTSGKYWKSFSKLFHITRRLRLVFQLNACVFPKDLTQYLSRYNPMIERTNLSRWMTQLSLRYSCWLVCDF